MKIASWKPPGGAFRLEVGEKQKTRNGGDDQLGILPKLNTDLIVVHDEPSFVLSSS